MPNTIISGFNNNPPRKEYYCRLLIFLLLLFVNHDIHSQCNVKKEIDDFEGAIIYTIKPKLVTGMQNYPIRLGFRKRITGETVAYTCIVRASVGSPPKCFNDKSKISLILSDDQVINLYNRSGIDCNSPAIIMICRIDNTYLEVLSSMEIKKMRVYFSEFKRDYSPTNKSIFIDGLNCLFAEE